MFHHLPTTQSYGSNAQRTSPALGQTPRRRATLIALMAAFALVANSACGGGDAEKKPTPAEGVSAQLRRVEVVSSTFSEMSLRVIVALNNPSQSDVTLRQGDIEMSIAGKAKPIDADDDSVASDDAAEDSDATEEGEAGDASDDDESGESEDVEGDDESGDDDDDSDLDDVDTSGIVDGAWHKGQVSGVTIPAYAQSEVAIDLILPLPSEPGALERMLQWQRMVVEIKGTLAMGGAQETFKGRRELGLPVFPQVLLQGAQISSIDGGTDGEAYLTLEIDNPNPFPIQVDKFAWGASVGGKEMRPMRKPRAEEVPPSSRLQSDDTIKLNEETFGKDVKALLSKPSVPYTISGFYEVRGIRREFKFEGDMAFAR